MPYLVRTQHKLRSGMEHPFGGSVPEQHPGVGHFLFLALAAYLFLSYFYVRGRRTLEVCNQTGTQQYTTNRNRRHFVHLDRLSAGSILDFSYPECHGQPFSGTHRMRIGQYSIGLL